jgi:GH15 family glucan-1,4-alpha-glucosidase
LTVDYLLASWRRPCYDWWEEHDEHVHVSTLGSVGAGLLACADSGLLDDDREHRARETVERIRALIAARATVDGHLTKWLGTDEVDGSLSALIAPLGFVDAGSPLASATLARIENQIMTDGGVYRFRADTFYGGGRWPLLTCFYGLAKAAAGDLKAARDALEWAAGTALPDGALPEQVDGHLLHPDHRQEWIDRWGPVATPLLWSHAMLLRLATEIDRIEESA